MGRDFAGETAGDGEGVDAVAGAVALEEVPFATVGLWVPGGEDVRIIEGLLYLEEDFLVLGVAELGVRRVNNGGEEKGEDQKWPCVHFLGLEICL